MSPLYRTALTMAMVKILSIAFKFYGVEVLVWKIMKI